MSVVVNTLEKSKAFAKELMEELFFYTEHGDEAHRKQLHDKLLEFAEGPMADKLFEEYSSGW